MSSNQTLAKISVSLIAKVEPLSLKHPRVILFGPVDLPRFRFSYGFSTSVIVRSLSRLSSRLLENSK